MNPFLSIIIPVYNKGRYLNKCIQSIVDQNFTDWEIILVDDGSSDSSPAICDQWSTRDSRIRVLHQKNAGVSTARNEGMKLVRGEYLQFTDADDWWESGALLHIYTECLQANRPDALIYGIKKVYPSGNEATLIPQRVGNYYIRDFFFNLIPDQSQQGLYGSVWSKILSRAIIQEHHILFNSKYTLMEDYDFFLEYCKYSNRISIISYGGYCYQLETENSTTLPSFRFHYPYVMKIRVKAWQYVENICGKIQSNDVWLQHELNSHYLGMFTDMQEISLSRIYELHRECLSLLPYSFKYTPVGSTANTRIVAFLLKYKLFILLCIYLKIRAFKYKYKPRVIG